MQDVVMNAYRRRLAIEEVRVARHLSMHASIHGSPKKAHKYTVDNFIPPYFKETDFGMHHELQEYHDVVYPQKARLRKKLENLIQQRKGLTQQVSQAVNGPGPQGMDLLETINELSAEIAKVKAEYDDQ